MGAPKYVSRGANARSHGQSAALLSTFAGIHDNRHTLATPVLVALGLIESQRVKRSIEFLAGVGPVPNNYQRP